MHQPTRQDLEVQDALGAMRYAVDVGLVGTFKRLLEVSEGQIRASDDPSARDKLDELARLAELIKERVRRHGKAMAIDRNHPDVKRWLELGFVKTSDLDRGRLVFDRVRSASASPRQQPR